MVNYQCEKKCSDNLEKNQKKAIVLEGELRKWEEKLATTAVAAEELKKKKEGEIAGLCQVAHDPIYQRIYDCGWNRVNNLYVCDAAEDRAKAFHEGQLALPLWATASR